jgi:hypothetical protein
VFTIAVTPQTQKAIPGTKIVETVVHGVVSDVDVVFVRYQSGVHIENDYVRMI